MECSDNRDVENIFEMLLYRSGLLIAEENNADNDGYRTRDELISHDLHILIISNFKFWDVLCSSNLLIQIIPAIYSLPILAEIYPKGRSLSVKARGFPE